MLQCLRSKQYSSISTTAFGRCVDIVLQNVVREKNLVLHYKSIWSHVLIGCLLFVRKSVYFDKMSRSNMPVCYFFLQLNIIKVYLKNLSLHFFV